MAKLKIAVIPGDGIGWEVVPEGLKVLEAVGRKHVDRAAPVARGAHQV